MIEKIKDWIYKTVSNAVSKEVFEIKQSQLKHTADLARLIYDMNKKNISLQSIDFLCRMNINLKD